MRLWRPGQGAHPRRRCRRLRGCPAQWQFPAGL